MALDDIAVGVLGFLFLVCLAAQLIAGLKGLGFAALVVVWVALLGFIIFKWLEVYQTIDLDKRITYRAVGVAVYGFGILAVIAGTLRFVGGAISDWRFERRLERSLREDRRKTHSADRDDDC